MLFVAVDMGLRSAAGRVDVRQSRQLSGEVAQATRITEDAGREKPAGETVLVPAADGRTTAEDGSFRSAVTR